jgi:HK97 family phage major capsid protein
MTRLNELKERRAAALEAMRTHEEAGGEAFDKAKADYDGLAAQITRAEAIESAERHERGKPLVGDGKLETELRQFSIRRAIAGAAGMEGVDWGREREMQAELAKRAGRNPQGLFIPAEALETRATTSAANSGESLVPTDHRPELYISALTAQSVVRAMGATVLTGLTGNVDIPKEGDSPQPTWKAENTDFDEGDATFTSVELKPKHCGVITQWSRNMILQASPEVETLLRRMLARNLALGIDRAAISGAGVNEPLGLLNTPGIQTQPVAVPPADASLLDLTAAMIAKADIANVGAMRSFLGTMGVKEAALKTRDATGLPIGMDKLFHMEPRAFSNQVPSNLGDDDDEHGLIYGDWSELMIGVWSEIDILVNPYESAAYKKGNISLRAVATVDTACRHPQAFVSATGFKP